MTTYEYRVSIWPVSDFVSPTPSETTKQELDRQRQAEKDLEIPLNISGEFGFRLQGMYVLGSYLVVVSERETTEDEGDKPVQTQESRGA